MSDRTLTVAGLLAMAAAGVLAGSLAAQWIGYGRPPLLTAGIRVAVALGLYAAGLRAWAQRAR